MDTSRFQTERRRPRPETDILEDLEAYWQTLRHAQRLPARSDIAPDRIDHVLPHTFILQRVAPGVSRFRVAGQRLHELLKLDARGMPLGALFAPSARDQLQELVEAAFSEPAIIALPLVSEPTLMRPQITGTMLLLPMRDHENKSTRLLGALVTEAATGNRPRRFVIDPSRSLRHETVGPKVGLASVMPSAATPQKRPDATRPALKLVVNNG